VTPDGFFGIQIVQNSISAGALPRTPLEELTEGGAYDAPSDRLVNWGEGYPSPFSPQRLSRLEVLQLLNRGCARVRLAFLVDEIDT